MKKPKILVGCPTSNHKDYCWQQYVAGVKQLRYENKDILVVDNSEGDEYFNQMKQDLPVVKDEYLEHAKDRIVHSRNVLRKKVLDEGYDYFLSLEQDVVPPVNVIEQLLSRGKNIVSAVYYNPRKTVDGRMAVAALLYKKTGENENGEDLVRPMAPAEVEGKGLMPVSSCGLGVVLIHRDVLEKVEFRHVKEKSPFDDMWFCMDAKNAGFEIFADGNIICEHHVKRNAWKDIKK